jgi:hypothetical protein
VPPRKFLLRLAMHRKGASVNIYNSSGTSNRTLRSGCLHGAAKVLGDRPGEVALEG